MGSPPAHVVVTHRIQGLFLGGSGEVLDGERIQASSVSEMTGLGAEEGLGPQGEVQGLSQDVLEQGQRPGGTENEPQLGKISGIVPVSGQS